MNKTESKEPTVSTTESSDATVYFFPDILGDGRAVSVEAKSREEAEQLARKKLEGES